jgi:hypothetical protein
MHLRFSRRVTLVLLCVAVLALLSIGTVASKSLHGAWGAALIYAPVLVLLTYEWRLIARQRPFAHIADQMEQLREAIPPGMQRLYLPSEGRVAVQCNPAASVWKTHQFTCLQLDDVADLDRAEAEEVVYVGAVTYKMAVGLPLVQRVMWAEGTFKHSKHGDFHALPRPKRSVKGALRSMVLDHKAGVLTPTADELSNLVQIMRNPHHVIDTPLRDAQ